jgi:hypothetical protein
VISTRIPSNIQLGALLGTLLSDSHCLLPRLAHRVKRPDLPAVQDSTDNVNKIYDSTVSRSDGPRVVRSAGGAEVQWAIL